MIDKMICECYTNKKGGNIMTKEVSANINESLPYYATVDGIKKLIEAIKKKPGDEKSVKTLFGEGKYAECKRALVFFDIISQDVAFTERGKRIAYENDEMKRVLEWRNVIRGVTAYDDFLNYYILNKKGQASCDIETVKNHWALKNVCKNDTMRKDAAITFANVLSFANLGEFKKGKKGNSRIELNLQELIAFCEQVEAAEEPISNNISSDAIIENPILSSVGHFCEKTEERTDSNQNVIVNINVSITANDVNELKAILDLLNDKSTQS